MQVSTLSPSLYTAKTMTKQQKININEQKQLVNNNFSNNAASAIKSIAFAGISFKGETKSNIEQKLEDPEFMEKLFSKPEDEGIKEFKQEVSENPEDLKKAKSNPKVLRNAIVAEKNMLADSLNEAGETEAKETKEKIKVLNKCLKEFDKMTDGEDSSVQKGRLLNGFKRKPWDKEFRMDESLRHIIRNRPGIASHPTTHRIMGIGMFAFGIGEVVLEKAVGANTMLNKPILDKAQEYFNGTGEAGHPFETTIYGLIDEIPKEYGIELDDNQRGRIAGFDNYIDRDENDRLGAKLILFGECYKQGSRNIEGCLSHFLSNCTNDDINRTKSALHMERFSDTTDFPFKKYTNKEHSVIDRVVADINNR